MKLSQKNYNNFLRKTKRLKQSCNRIHIRILRKGQVREFYYCDDINFEIELVDIKKRRDAYDTNYLNRLYEKIRKEKQNENY